MVIYLHVSWINKQAHTHTHTHTHACLLAESGIFTKLEGHNIVVFLITFNVNGHILLKMAADIHLGMACLFIKVCHYKINPTFYPYVTRGEWKETKAVFLDVYLGFF